MIRAEAGETAMGAVIDPGDTVFVSVDIQERPRAYWTPERMAEAFGDEREFGQDELNDAIDHFFDVLLPNAVKVAEWARENRLPRIFIHWSTIQDKDLPRPNDAFTIVPGDFVVSKTEMDAFISSNIAEILAGLGRRTLLMIGGHTRGCLGETAKSALAAGFRCVAVRDATYDVSIIRWPLGLAEVPYHAVIDAKDLE
jgi:nicotinamidase-related amidase